MDADRRLPAESWGELAILLLTGLTTNPSQEAMVRHLGLELCDPARSIPERRETLGLILRALSGSPPPSDSGEAAMT